MTITASYRHTEINGFVRFWLPDPRRHGLRSSVTTFWLQLSDRSSRSCFVRAFQKVAAQLEPSRQTLQGACLVRTVQPARHHGAMNLPINSPPILAESVLLCRAHTPPQETSGEGAASEQALELRLSLV